MCTDFNTLGVIRTNIIGKTTKWDFAHSKIKCSTFVGITWDKSIFDMGTQYSVEFLNKFKNEMLCFVIWGFKLHCLQPKIDKICISTWKQLGFKSQQLSKKSSTSKIQRVKLSHFWNTPMKDQVELTQSNTSDSSNKIVKIRALDKLA